jgi:uncharacterized SAM-binding protein YcdF (DUF218 family)
MGIRRYYLLNQRRLIGPTGAVVADEEVAAARSLANTWTDLMETWRIWRDLAAQGVALGTGRSGPAQRFSLSAAGFRLKIRSIARIVFLNEIT